MLFNQSLTVFRDRFFQFFECREEMRTNTYIYVDTFTSKGS